MRTSCENSYCRLFDKDANLFGCSYQKLVHTHSDNAEYTILHEQMHLVLHSSDFIHIFATVIPKMGIRILHTRLRPKI